MSVQNVFNRKTAVLLLLIFGALLAISPAGMRKATTLSPREVASDVINRSDHITAEELAALIIDKDPNLLIVDLRSAEEYNQFHIEGAINIPVSAIYSRLGEIPKDSLIIVYCDGSSCGRSSNAASILIDSGYTQIFNLVGKGIHEWVEKGYPKVENIS